MGPLAIFHSGGALQKPLVATVVATLVLAASGCSQANRPAAGSPATLVELNRAAAAMTMMNGRCPTDVHELTNFPYLRHKTLPQPPAGKKFVIDPATRRVVIVAQ